MSKNSKAKINEDAWKMSNGNEFTNSYQQFLNSPYSKYMLPAVSKSNHKYLDANNKNDTDDVMAGAGSTFGQIFGGPLGAVAGAAGGKMLGGMISEYFDQKEMEAQKANEKELANYKNNLSLQNMAMAPQIQKNAMENAGMNPAMGAGNFTTAPTAPAGGAATPNMNLANVFEGLGDLIKAAKAPTETDLLRAQKELTESQTSKTSAETGKIGAETEKLDTETKLLIPTNIKSLEASADKMIADTKNAKNLAEIFESKTKGINEMGKTIFGTYKTQMEQDGSWNKLTDEQKQTIDDIVEGKTILDVGKLEALKDLIGTKGQLSDTDTRILSNTLDNKITTAKLNDPKFAKATAEMPDTLKRKVEAEIRSYNQDIAESKKRVGLIGAETNRTTIEARSKVVNDPNLMRDLGLKKELDNYYKTKGINDGAELVKETIKGGVTGAVLRGIKTPKVPKTKTNKNLTGNDYGL